MFQRSVRHVLNIENRCSYLPADSDSERKSQAFSQNLSPVGHEPLFIDVYCIIHYYSILYNNALYNSYYRLIWQNKLNPSSWSKQRGAPCQVSVQAKLLKMPEAAAMWPKSWTAWTWAWNSLHFVMLCWTWPFQQLDSWCSRIASDTMFIVKLGQW